MLYSLSRHSFITKRLLAWISCRCQHESAVGICWAVLCYLYSLDP